jgi:hypothetical protein
MEEVLIVVPQGLLEVCLEILPYLALGWPSAGKEQRQGAWAGWVLIASLIAGGGLGGLVN